MSDSSSWFINLFGRGAEVRRLRNELHEALARSERLDKVIDQMRPALPMPTGPRVSRATRAVDTATLTQLVERKRCIHEGVKGTFCPKCGEEVGKCSHEWWAFRLHGGRCPDCKEMMVDLEGAS